MQANIFLSSTTQVSQKQRIKNCQAFNKTQKNQKIITSTKLKAHKQGMVKKKHIKKLFSTIWQFK